MRLLVTRSAIRALGNAEPPSPVHTKERDMFVAWRTRLLDGRAIARPLGGAIRAREGGAA